jgi:hypothetical protein
MNMQNKAWYIAGGAVFLAISVYGIASMPKKKPVQTNAQSNAQQQSPSVSSSANNAQTTSTSVPSSANSPSDDPQDIVPGLYKNPIQNTAAADGFVITDSKVENNTDKAGKAIGDHLELTLKNTAGKDLTDFEAYYMITDTVTSQKEGYYKKLTGFVLKSGETQAIHFDNGTDPGHFSANKDSLYYKSPNKLTFDITVSAAGYKIQTVQISKDAGGAEQVD